MSVYMFELYTVTVLSSANDVLAPLGVFELTDSCAFSINVYMLSSQVGDSFTY